jgi:hypothetical protein
MKRNERGGWGSNNKEKRKKKPLQRKGEEG